MSMIRKRSHSNTNVSKKEKPPQQESGMAHPFSSCVDCSLDNTDGASENELWVQIVTQMLAIVNITITVWVPAIHMPCSPEMWLQPRYYISSSYTATALRGSTR